MTFEPAVADDIPEDSVPPQADVEYPCQVCGKEAGPYGGRGRKPKFCPEHKKGTPKSSGGKVTGASASLAAQATATLVQINGLLAVGAMATGMYRTASMIAEQNPSFEEAAYQALLTDPELCRLITKAGVKSAKLSLGLAYLSFAAPVAMTAYSEAKEKQDARRARLEQEADVNV